MEKDKQGFKICLCNPKLYLKRKDKNLCEFCIGNHLNENSLDQKWSWVEEFHCDIFNTKSKISFELQELFLKRCLESCLEINLVNELELFIEWIYYLFFNTSYITGDKWKWSDYGAKLHWKVWFDLKDLNFDNFKERLCFHIVKGRDIEPSHFDWILKMIQIKVFENP